MPPPTEQLGEYLPSRPMQVNKLYPVIIPILTNHGCIIEYGGTSLTYPPGTKRREILPRTMCMRIKVTLPDGMEIQEIENPRRTGIDISIVVPDQGSAPFTDEEYRILTTAKEEKH